jgi:hypothetical protein
MTDILIMKKFEILRELPKCDTETRSEHMLLGKVAPTDLLNPGLSQTFNSPPKCNICEAQYLARSTNNGSPL